MVRARDHTFWGNIHLPPHVTCHMSIFFFLESGWVSRWRVCYQRGLPRLVFAQRARKGLGRSPPQELEVGPRSGPYLLVLIKGVRETVPSQTSDMGKKTVSVLAHSCFLPLRANSIYILSITPLRLGWCLFLNKRDEKFYQYGSKWLQMAPN